jgi:hypothetical protein
MLGRGEAQGRGQAGHRVGVGPRLQTALQVADGAYAQPGLPGSVCAPHLTVQHSLGQSIAPALHARIGQ